MYFWTNIDIKSTIIILLLVILAIPVYFLSIWIVNKFKIEKEENRKILAIMATIIFSPIIYFGIIIIWIFSITYYPKIDFNKQKWESNKDERYKMSEYIISNNMLIGKTKDEVINLLGNEYYNYNENHIAFYLGFVPSIFKIDPDLLDIYFENGKVTKVGQHES